MLALTLMLSLEAITDHYNEHFDKMCKRFSPRDGGIMDGEDIAQEGYARAIKYRASFDHARHKIDAWILCIHYNCAKDHRRNAQAVTHPEPEDYTETAEDMHYRKAKAKEAIAIMQSYPSPKRDILELWYHRDYSPKDISNVLDVTYNVARGTINNFIDNMKQELGED